MTCQRHFTYPNDYFALDIDISLAGRRIALIYCYGLVTDLDFFRVYLTSNSNVFFGSNLHCGSAQIFM